MNNSANEKPATKLDPLPKTLDGEHEEVELVFTKCKHELEIISSFEVRCKKCHAGWHGEGVYKLLGVS